MSLQSELTVGVVNIPEVMVGCNFIIFVQSLYGFKIYTELALLFFHRAVEVRDVLKLILESMPGMLKRIT